MPDNAGFYHAAYLITVIIYAAYGLSIASRIRATRRLRARADSGAEQRDSSG